MIQCLVILICAILKLIGELWQHNAQRFIMPIVLGVGISLVTHVWWLGFMTLIAIGPITLGYKVFNLGDAGNRGMWLFLIALVIGVGPCSTHHLAWYFYMPYTIVAGIWGATTRNLWNVVIAPISGALLASVILFIK